jgi:hypothetical protein
VRKIPTLFQRDPEHRARLLPELTPGCGWVLSGEGVAKRKYDGTCVMWDGRLWWGRREVKLGKMIPAGFRQVQTDPITGKAVGWEPIQQTPFYKAFEEAVEPLRMLGGMLRTELPPGTFELIGPKINGNPEKAEVHRLESHANAESWATNDVTPPWINTTEAMFEHLREFVTAAHEHEGWEGIVWHHPDGRMVKLKARDFPKGPPLTCDQCPGESFGYNEAILAMHQRNAHGQDV